MQEYTFTSVALLRQRDGTELDHDYHEVIREHAREGWRFVQAIPFESASQPRLDLVFRRKVKQ